jgi:hypothetical protein
VRRKIKDNKRPVKVVFSLLIIAMIILLYQVFGAPKERGKYYCIILY